MKKIIKKTINIVLIVAMVLSIFLPLVVKAGGLISDRAKPTDDSVKEREVDTGSKYDAVNKSEYSITYNTKSFNTTHKFTEKYTLYYSDSYFLHPSTEYDSHLSTLSMYMTYFSMIMGYPENENDTKWYNEQVSRIRGFFDNIGFENFATNSDYTSRTRFDSIGVAVASRKIGNDTVIAVVPRSGGYYREWGNNVWLGDGSQSDYMHEGWYKAANNLITFLDQYVSNNNITGNVKLWMAGYSRGGATTNIAAGLLDNKLDKGQTIFSNGAKLTHNDLFAYTFEAPQGANVYSKTVKAPTDKIYNNIFNIVNPNDLVPKVAMSEWGFTRFGIDKYITTKFYNPERYGDNRNVYKALWTNDNGKQWENYKGDDLTVRGITGDQLLMIDYMPLGSLEAVIEFATYGLEMFKEDTTKANYDANIVSTIILEDMVSRIGSRENYVNKYQGVLKNTLSEVMNDNMQKANEATDAAIEAFIFAAVQAKLNEKYMLGSIYGDDLPGVMVPLLLSIFDEHPTELLTLGLNAGNVFQNHEPIVTITHMEAQDSYYIDDYNKSHTNRIYIVPLHDNADMFRAEFFGFNDLLVWKADDVSNWAQEVANLNSPNKLVNVDGHLLGKSDVTYAQSSCAVGYYSYTTEEKMKLFCQANHKYRISMKAYSKQVNHTIEYKGYYQRFRVDGVDSIQSFQTTVKIPNKFKLLDSYSDKIDFNSDYIISNISAYTALLTGTAFGTGSIIIISIAGLVLVGLTIYSFIYVKRKKNEQESNEHKLKNNKKSKKKK